MSTTDEPDESPAAFACKAASARLWRDRRRFVGTHPDLDEAAGWRVPASPEILHALTLVLSRLPEEERRPFADGFFELRGETRTTSPRTPEARLRAAAAVALLVLELTQDGRLRSDRIADLLTGAAQGDDLTTTPAPTVDEVQKAVAHVRYDVDLEDEVIPRAAASLAVVEVLDPSSDGVALKEILARAAWAAVESWDRPRVLAFLLEADRALADAA
jgi:hypothetical protein